MSPAPIPAVKPGEKAPPFSELKAMFAYDTDEPLAFTWLPNMDLAVSGVTMRGILYQSRGESVSGYLALPAGQGPFPVVVFAPGYDPSTGVLDYWAKDAARLAKKGYAGLLVEETGRLWTWDGQADVRGLVDHASQERRAIDLLETMPEIDATRIGFAGFSTGAILGGLLSGLDPRVKAFVLDGMGNGGLSMWAADDRARMKSQGISPEAYDAQMSLVDPTAYLKHNKGSRFLFIWAKEGDDAPPALQKRFVAAAGPRATVYMQPGYHWISPQARKVLEAWLVEDL